MAQNLFINVTADPAAASKPESSHSHTVSGGASASGDFTISLDTTKITSLAILDSILKAARLRLIGGGLK